LKRTFILLVPAAAAVALAFGSAHGNAAAAKRSICHRTGSAARPYVKLSVTAAQLRTHTRHAADIVPAPAGGCPRTILTAAAGGVTINATLTGEAENPAGDPVATGTATIHLRKGQGQACFTLATQNLPSAAVAAHIHRGALGTPGAIVVPLTTPNAEGQARGCVPANRVVVGQILAAPAQYYVNVHTEGFPGGATRGQLGGSGPTAGWVASVQLSGTVERPAGDPDGAGTAVVRIRDDGQVCYRLSVQNIQLPAVGAHIHRGGADVAGPIVVPFTAPDASGGSTACTTADPALLNDIRSNPAGFYANVHTRDFPGGAVRAQLG
jgi:hypothetical protein